MRVRKISAFIMASLLVLSSLTLFSLADGGEVILKDSGSPVAFTFFLRQSASVMSTRAVTLPSAPEGFEWIEVDTSDFEFRGSATNAKEYQIYGDLMPGTYFASLTLSQNYYRFGVWDTEEGYRITSDEINYSSSEGSAEFSLDSAVEILFYGYFDKGENVSNVSVVDFQLYELKYIPSSGSGVSSGYTYSSGIIENTTRSIFKSFSPSFGVLPAGKYLINIYHWGDAYDVRFQISNVGESIYYPTSTSGGVTTFIYDHDGGSMQIEGSFTASNVDTSVVDGSIYGSGFSGSGEYNSSYVGGTLKADGPLSWVFNITDVVAIPLEGASDSDYGIFSLIVGFLRNQFEDMKSFLSIQFDKIAGDSETKTDVDDAQSELQKEVEDLNNLSGQLDTQASNLEQQFTTDFAIPDTVSGQGTNFQSIYTSLFGSLGVFGIFIWLPIVMAVIKKLLRL